MNEDTQMTEQQDDKAVIRIREGSVGDAETEIPVRFNPTEYSHEKSINYADQNMLGFSSPVTQFVSGEAENSDTILFFDEADALFGKRSEVSDAHDRYANIEVNYLLQRVEEHDGAVILTTNFEGNIDDAFLRRIHLSVNFPRPDKEAREQIWRGIFPAEKTLSGEKETTPRGELDYEFLSGFELTGGNIKNIALAASFLAAGPRTDVEYGTWREEREALHELVLEEIGKNGDLSFEFLDIVEMEHVVWAMRREFQKMRKLIKREAFGECRVFLPQ